jgi:hypothetical protein
LGGVVCVCVCLSLSLVSSFHASSSLCPLACLSSLVCLSIASVCYQLLTSLLFVF